MSKNDLAPYMAEFLRLVANEIENNKSLAKRLSPPLLEFLQENQEKKKTSSSSYSQKNTEKLIPEGFDPFQIFHEKGSVGLFSALQNMDAASCKAVLSHFALDPTRSYNRWRKQERLADFIVQRVKAMTSKGEVFK